MNNTFRNPTRAGISNRALTLFAVKKRKRKDSLNLNKAQLRTKNKRKDWKIEWVKGQPYVSYEYETSYMHTKTKLQC